METDRPGFFADIKDIAEKYIHDRLLLAKLEASEKIAGIVSRLYIFIPLIIILFIILLLVTFLGGYYLSVWLNAYWAGFGIMLLLYILLFFLLIYFHHKKMKYTVADKVVQSIFDNKN